MAMDFSGLFKSPEDIRGQRIDTLMAESMQRKQMPLLQQVAAGRGGMMAEGLAGMFGLKTAEEAKAEKNKEAMAQVRAGNPESMLVAAERMREAGNVEGAFKLETMAAEAKSALQEAAYKRGEYEMKTGKLENILGVDLSKTTVESQAQAKQIILNGTVGGVTPTNVKEQALAVLKSTDEGTNIDIDLGKYDSSEWIKKLAAEDASWYGDARTTMSNVDSSQATIGMAAELLDSGIFTGTGADLKLGLAKAADVLGLAGKTDQDKIAATESFIATMARQTGQILSSGMLGSAQSLTDADRDFAKQMAAGDINMTEQGIREILYFTERANMLAVKAFNERAQEINDRYPDAKIPLKLMEGMTATGPTGTITYKRVGGVLGWYDGNNNPIRR